MLGWRRIISENLLPMLSGDDLWQECIQKIVFDDLYPAGLHLAVFVEPYLAYVLEGKKTVESRFSVNRNAPYGRVAAGDVILLKQSGGPILGLCKVTHVWFYSLDPISWKSLRREFTEALCAQDPQFWKQRENASYATLMQLSSVLPINPIAFPKQDRRGWIVLRHSIDSRLGTLTS